MAIAERDMVVIDAASWVRGVFDNKGFLETLPVNDLAALRLEWNGTFGDDHMRECYRRLFPEAASAGRMLPNEDDRDALRGRLRDAFRPVVLDRDKLRAHRFEPIRVPATGMPARLALAETAGHLERMQDLLVDLFYLSAKCAYLPWALQPDPEDTEARDVVDLILCGGINWIVDGPPSGHTDLTAQYRQRRTDYYDALHARHEKGPSNEPFNGPYVS